MEQQSLIEVHRPNLLHNFEHRQLLFLSVVCTDFEAIELERLCNAIFCGVGLCFSRSSGYVLRPYLHFITISSQKPEPNNSTFCRTIDQLL